MSSDPMSRHPRARRTFRRRLLGTVLALATLATALGIAGATQGPRLTGADVDPVRSVQLAGQQLRLDLNQQIAALDVDGVTVSPSTPVTVTHDASSIVVTFLRPLDYSRDYTVTVPDVVGAFGDARATVSHTFRTSDEYAYSLLRRSHTGETDAVLRRPPDRPGDQEIVFTAARIKDFAHYGDVMAAVTINANGNDTVYVAVPGAAEPQEITLPTVGSIRSLATSATNPLLGFVVTSAQGNGERMFENALFTVDLSGVVDSTARPVERSDGSVLPVMDWVFVPGTTSIVAQDYDEALFLVDLAGISPTTPVGRHSELRGFLPGTTTLVVADPDGGSLIDLTAGTTTAIELPESDRAAGRYLGKAALLDSDGSHLLALSAPSAPSPPSLPSSADEVTARESVLTYVTASGSRTVYEPPATSTIRDYCVSPNGQFVAVETTGADSVPDGYPGGGGFTNTLTLLVEISSGRMVASLSGGSSDWCSD